MLENLEPEASKRVELLREIQSQHDDLEGKFSEERATLEAKYQKMCEPIYSKCYDFVNAVVEVEGVTKEGSDETAEDQIEENSMSDFWFNAMENHKILVEERDEEALKYLKDIKWFRITEPKGFKLEFYFDTNPFFKNTVLTKTYHMIDEDEPILEKLVGTEIKWYPGKCLTQKVLKRKPEKGSKNAKPIIKTETCKSFFNFFSPPEVPDDDKDTAEQSHNQEQHYSVGYGSTISDKNTPHAVSWFTGEAAQDEDFKLEDEEDHDDEDDDDFGSSSPIPVFQIQHLLPLPLVLQKFFNHRAIVGGGRCHYPMVCHFLPPCPAACPGAGSMYPTPSLPDDVLADVLRRLSPHGLATSRCVCKSWHRVIDSHRLLRADLLPLSLGGIFLNFDRITCTQFLCRPTTGAAVSGRLYCTLAARFPEYDFVPCPKVVDHCNGLLLLRHCVVNPATQQWTPLPPAPDPPQPLPDMYLSTLWYLVFDPILSPNHFDVLVMPKVDFKLNNECEEFEWLPFTLILPVFSSKTCSWEERTFRREGEAGGMVPGMGCSHPFCNAYQCAYWRGALYICYSYFFVLRISLSDNTYRVIRLPTVRLPKDDPEACHEFFIGKSIKGIYCASILGSWSSITTIQLQVWFLNDLNEWVLKHDRDIFPILPNLNYDKPCSGPWTLQEFDYRRDKENGFVLEDKKEAMVEKEKFEWDSDDDNVLELGGSEQRHVDFLGFHPYKEVVLLSLWDRVLAYHWSSSKVQDLGKLFPKFYFLDGCDFFEKLVTESFPYTPCWLGELPGKVE